MVDAYAFLDKNTDALGLTPEHVEQLRANHREGSPFGVIDRVFEAHAAARARRRRRPGRAPVRRRRRVHEALDAAIDLHTVEWTGDGYDVLPWRPGASSEDLPELRHEMLENLGPHAPRALPARGTQREPDLRRRGELAEGGDTGLRFLMRTGAASTARSCQTAVGAAGLRNRTGSSGRSASGTRGWRITG
jgi:hypothetical protein